MALDIHGFVIPEQSFKGLTDVGEIFAKKKAAAAAAAAAKQEKKAVNAKWLSTYLNEKDYLTGTVYDPHQVEAVSTLLNNGMELANSGADFPTLFSYVNQGTKKISADAETLKELERQRKEASAAYKAIPGFDEEKFNKEFRNNAYLNPDGGLKDDISSIDHTKDYAGYTINNSPVWNAGAVSDYVSKATPKSYDTKVQVIQPNGSSRTVSGKMTHLDFMQPSYDEKGRFTGQWSPKTEYHTDGGVRTQEPVLDAEGNQVMENGKPVMQDVKLLPLNEYKGAMQSPGFSLFIRQQTRAAGLNPDDPKSIPYQQKISWDYLNETSRDKGSLSETKIEKAAPINVNVRTGGGKDGGEAPFNPIYQKLNTIASDMIDNKKYNFIPINKLPGDVADALIKSYASAIGKDVTKVKTSEFAVNRLPNGQWGLFTAEEGKPVGNVVKTLSEDELNVGFAKGKGERGAILKNETKLPTAQKYKLSNGKTITYNDLINAGYSDEKIKKAISLGNIKAQ